MHTKKNHVETCVPGNTPVGSESSHASGQLKMISFPCSGVLIAAAGGSCMDGGSEYEHACDPDADCASNAQSDDEHAEQLPNAPDKFAGEDKSKANLEDESKADPKDESEADPEDESKAHPKDETEDILTKVQKNYVCQY
jgi:hypothetical protein